MIFGYTLQEARKAVAVFVVAVIAAVAYFLSPLPHGFQHDVVVLVGLAFAVIGAFKATNSDPEDETKAIMALIGGVVTLVALFVQVPDLTAVEKVIALVLPLVLHEVVKQTPNGPAARVHRP